jgi:hypothetical protein
MAWADEGRERLAGDGDAFLLEGDALVLGEDGLAGADLAVARADRRAPVLVASLCCNIASNFFHDLRQCMQGTQPGKPRTVWVSMGQYGGDEELDKTTRPCA